MKTEKKRYKKTLLHVLYDYDGEDSKKYFQQFGLWSICWSRKLTRCRHRVLRRNLEHLKLVFERSDGCDGSDSSESFPTSTSSSGSSHQNDFLCSAAAPSSANSSRDTHIFLKVVSAARMDPPIHVDNCLSGGAYQNRALTIATRF